MKLDFIDEIKSIPSGEQIVDCINAVPLRQLPRASHLMTFTAQTYRYDPRRYA